MSALSTPSQQVSAPLSFLQGLTFSFCFFLTISQHNYNSMGFFKVQEAVANCLPPLVPAIKEEAPDIIKNLLTKVSIYSKMNDVLY